MRCQSFFDKSTAGKKLFSLSVYSPAAHAAQRRRNEQNACIDERLKAYLHGKIPRWLPGLLSLRLWLSAHDHVQ